MTAKSYSQRIAELDAGREAFGSSVRLGFVGGRGSCACNQARELRDENNNVSFRVTSTTCWIPPHRSLFYSHSPSNLTVARGHVVGKVCM
jgi:hypothetical protein